MSLFFISLLAIIISTQTFSLNETVLNQSIISNSGGWLITPHILGFLVFLSGIICILTLLEKKLKIDNFCLLKIDNNKIIPKDVLGNVVHPFIIDGTTYLPVRAISEALGKNVEWEGETYSVYITNPNEKKEIKTFSGEIEKKIHQETM